MTTRHCGLDGDCANIFFWQAQIKLEAFGFAIADATRALELDSNYVKVSCCWEGTRDKGGCTSMQIGLLNMDANWGVDLGILAACVSQHCHP